MGFYAVQMARLAAAAQVIATVSSDTKATITRDAGAHDIVDYRRENLVERVAALTGGPGVDRVIEVDIATNAAADFAMLAPGGLAVAYGSSQPDAAVPFVPGIMKNLRLAFFIVYLLPPDARRQAQAQAQLDQWLARGELKHLIAERLPRARSAELSAP